MKPARSVDINLLPKDPFYESIVGRVILWSLSVGRYLLIFTLATVIISFASRFNLDRQRTDLNAKIFQQLSVIESYGSLESEFRAAQHKIQVYADASDQKTSQMYLVVFQQLLHQTYQLKNYQLLQR